MTAINEYCPICGKRRRGHERGWWDRNPEQFFHPRCRIQFAEQTGARKLASWLFVQGILDDRSEDDRELIINYLREEEDAQKRKDDSD